VVNFSLIERLFLNVYSVMTLLSQITDLLVNPRLGRIAKQTSSVKHPVSISRPLELL